MIACKRIMPPHEEWHYYDNLPDDYLNSSQLLMGMSCLHDRHLREPLERDDELLLLELVLRDELLRELLETELLLLDELLRELPPDTLLLLEELLRETPLFDEVLREVDDEAELLREVLDELVERLPDAFTELSEVVRRVVPVVLLLLVRAVPVEALLRVAVPTPEVLPRRVEADVPVRSVVEAERLPVAALRDDPVRVGTLDVTAVRRFSSESVLTTRLLASREGILT